MVDAREKTLVEAARNGAKKAPAARKSRRRKKEKDKPEAAVKEEWLRQLHAAFGMRLQISWKEKEWSLARHLLEYVDLETALKMIERCIVTWRREGVPSFGWFWAGRDSYKAMVLGQAASTRDLDEYDEERDGKSPKVGW